MVVVVLVAVVVEVVLVAVVALVALVVVMLHHCFGISAGKVHYEVYPLDSKKKKIP